VAEIMGAAGLTHGGFYAHFKSKGDLVAQAITHMFDASYARFLGHTEGRDAAEALTNFIDAYFAGSHRLNRAGGCPIAAPSDDLPKFPELARARFTDGTERFVAGLAQLIERLGAKNADALAWSAMAEMAGALALSRAMSDPDRATKNLRNSRAMVRARIGLDRSPSRGD
jgi:TetR/AcrR family transcriptional repressor of nem operon